MSSPRFSGPDEQYRKAIDHLNKRPEPDEENCVKDAVGAVEGVANIIAGTSGAQLTHLLAKDRLKSALPPTVKEALKKVYAYRGAAPGAAHSLVGPPTVDLDDATWVLTVSAATLIYLEGKFKP